MREDVLTRLDRVLDEVPEHAFATPPLPRNLVAAAAAEIRTLRARLAAATRSQVTEGDHAQQ
jgi:hypothetical protein